MTIRSRPGALGMTAVALSGLFGLACDAGDLEDRTAQASEAVEGAGLPTSSRPGSAAPAPPSAPSGSNVIELDALGYTLGSPDAPIRVIEFSDFGCGYCRKFHQETYPALVRDYVETGVISWQYIPYVLGIFPHGLEAALAGECAGEQGLIDVYGARLFEDQPEWKNHDGAVGDIFIRYAREEGLDVERFTQCIVEDWRRDRVRSNVVAGGQLGVRGTPTFFIPGYAPLSGALPEEMWAQAVEIILADQQKAGGQ